MKKLMIAAAVAMAAVCSQAVAINWNSSALYKAADAKGTFGTTTSYKAKDAVSAYLFNIDKDTYDKLIAATYAEASANVWKAYGDKLDTATATVTSKSSTSIAKLTDGVNYTPAVDTTYYAAIIYTYTDTTYGDMYIANLASGVVGEGQTGDTTITALNTTFGGAAGTEAIKGWTAAAVPEPTSGLLLLLGVAGLALRRRRA